MGMYAVLSVLFLFLIYLEVQRGPDGGADRQPAPAMAAAAN
jgi:hypothetical protein